jgi:hypothetical protein
MGYAPSRGVPLEICRCRPHSLKCIRTASALYSRGKIVYARILHQLLQPSTLGSRRNAGPPILRIFHVCNS